MLADSTTIEVIFSRMVARYASAWFAKYEGVEPEIVAKDWLHALEGVPVWAVDFALENTPADFPPNAGQFRGICMRASKPVERTKRIEAPKPDPARLKRELQRLHSMLKVRGPKQWAYDLQEREAKGEQLSEFQRTAWRQALSSPANLALSSGGYDFQQEELPPGMRTKKVNPADVEMLRQHVTQKVYARAGRKPTTDRVTSAREASHESAPRGHSPMP